MTTYVKSGEKVKNWKTIIGEVNKIDVFTDRVKKLEEEFLAAPRHISAKRSRLATESWKETEAYPLTLRRAKVFQKIVEGNPIAIWNDELIVGSQSEFLRGSSPPTDFLPAITLRVVNADKPTTGILSPSQGKDVKGPTAILLSATKINHLEHAVASLHNLKLSPSTLYTREGINKFLSLIKTYFDLGGWHLQFNMISQEAMLEAQKHPEQHRDLVVRVAGYSAFFIDLSPEVQNDIIRRTEYRI